MLQRILMICMLLFSMMLFACGSDKEEEVTEMSEELEQTAEKLNSGEMDMTEAMTQMQQVMSGGENVTPVNFRKLKALLPKTIKGIAGSNFEGEKTGGFGIKVSSASADYNDGSKGSMTISITDMGTMKGFAAMASAAWLNAEIDRESDDEFEQTFTYKGNKAHKKYNTRSKRGEISTIIAGRFVVNVKGRKFPFSRLEEALDELPLDELEDMKNEGIE
ncbi:MAG: hypothetical protein DWQ05_21695 [Calditrichaeota bacterium]|nr:MAG: hypothetical protein DWQ05_21695 [Calditrichota bacterium]